MEKVIEAKTLRPGDIIVRTVVDGEKGTSAVRYETVEKFEQGPHVVDALLAERARSDEARQEICRSNDLSPSVPPPNRMTREELQADDSVMVVTDNSRQEDWLISEEMFWPGNRGVSILAVQ